VDEVQSWPLKTAIVVERVGDHMFWMRDTTASNSMIGVLSVENRRLIWEHQIPNVARAAAVEAELWVIFRDGSAQVLNAKGVLRG
jgi:hypothetical protein